MWCVETWCTSTNRVFHTYKEALEYVRSGPDGNDWYIEAINL